MLMFEFSKNQPKGLDHIMDNFTLIKAADLDTCVLASSDKGFGIKNTIHIWITPTELEIGSLMILIGFVIMGHPEWKRATIKIFAIFPVEEMSEVENLLVDVIKTGRLPISPNNIELIPQDDEVSAKEIINQKSTDADLTMIGFRSEAVKQKGSEVFLGYEEIGNVLFVNTTIEKEIN